MALDLLGTDHFMMEIILLRSTLFAYDEDNSPTMKIIPLRPRLFPYDEDYSPKWGLFPNKHPITNLTARALSGRSARAPSPSIATNHPQLLTHRHTRLRALTR